jgi:hypothetical protein
MLLLLALRHAPDLRYGPRKKQSRASPGTGSITREVDRYGNVRYYGRITLGGRRFRTIRFTVGRPYTDEEARDEARTTLKALVLQLGKADDPEPPVAGQWVRLNDPAFRRWIWERDSGRCGICRRPVGLDEMHIDHVRPILEGGDNHVTNLRISHARCNTQRGALRRKIRG